MQLDWSLVVPTLNRHDCLIRSLRANINQTRPPKQVIVIDASDDWQQARERVFSELRSTDSPIQWTYVGAKKRSLTHQRNEGISDCSAEVAFLLDDDSFMYRDCAEQVMKVYELDESGSVAGVCAFLASCAEGSTPTPAGDGSPLGLARRLSGQFQRYWEQEELFIPYDGRYHKRPAPVVLEEMALPVGLFHGCRMTFRTDALRKVGGFEELLLRSAYCEDGDCSYRISRTGSLVAARRAWVYHEQTVQERPKRKLNTLLILLNAIALFELNKASGLRSSTVVYPFLAKRAVLEFVRDLTRARLSFPNMAAVLEALRLAPSLLGRSPDALRREYVEIQERLFQRG